MQWLKLGPQISNFTSETLLDNQTFGMSTILLRLLLFKNSMKDFFTDIAFFISAVYLFCNLILNFPHSYIFFSALLFFHIDNSHCATLCYKYILPRAKDGYSASIHENSRAPLM